MEIRAETHNRLRTWRECCDITAASHRFPWALPWRIPRNPLTTEVPAVDSNDSPDEARPPLHPDTVGTTLTGGASASGAAGQIGPYRLLRVLGEGGMGQVWLAEQKAPIQRTVALKLIKAGMDTKAVVARFESEGILLYNLGAVAGIRNRTDEAITLLNPAIDAGLPLGAAQNIERDPDLTPLRGNPRFPALVAHGREVAKANNKGG